MDGNYPRKKLPDELWMENVLGGKCLVELSAKTFLPKITWWITDGYCSRQKLPDE